MKITVELPVEELKAGDCTAVPITTENGVRILEAEVQLTDAHICALLKKNVKTVVVEKEQRYSSDEITAYKNQFRYYKKDTLRKDLIKLLYRHVMHKYES